MEAGHPVLRERVSHTCPVVTDEVQRESCPGDRSLCEHEGFLCQQFKSANAITDAWDAGDPFVWVLGLKAVPRGPCWDSRVPGSQ